MPVLRDFMGSRSAADIYEDEFIPAFFDAWAESMAAHVGRGQKVLDVACGTGVVSRKAAERAGKKGKVAGLDFMPHMLETAKRTVPAGLQVEWHQGNALDLPFSDRKFDLVLCQQGVQFMPDKVQALREMKRVAKRGGQVAASVWVDIRHMPVFPPLERAIATHLGADYVPLPPFAWGDPQELARTAREAGLEVEAVETQAKPALLKGGVRHMVLAFMTGVMRPEGDGVASGMVDPDDPAFDPGIEAVIKDVEEEIGDFVTPDGLSYYMITNLLRARA